MRGDRIERLDLPGSSMHTDWHPWGSCLSVTEHHVWVATVRQILRRRR